MMGGRGLIVRGARKQLGAGLSTIDDSYTYTAEDQPARTAEVLRDWLTTVG